MREATILKFGGTSAKSLQEIHRIASEYRPAALVVSALAMDGKRTTQLLKEVARCAANGLSVDEPIDTVVKLHEGWAGQSHARMLYDTLRNDLLRGPDAPDFFDRIVSRGEWIAQQVVASYLSSAGLPATFLSPEKWLLLDERREPLDYGRLALEERLDDCLPVIGGYFGVGTDGSIKLLSDGGSDKTGAIVADFLNADSYIIFSDKPGMFTAHPDIVAEARPIRQLTYIESREMAIAGATIIHHEAMKPLYRKHIPILIKETANPEAPGSRIVSSRDDHAEIVGIAHLDSIYHLYTYKLLADKEPAYGERLFHILAQEGVSYNQDMSTADQVSPLIKDFPLEKQQRVVERLLNEMDMDAAFVDDSYGLVCVVGHGLENDVTGPAIMDRITHRLRQESIPVRSINYPPKAVSATLLFKPSYVHDAVRALHKEFFE